MNSLPASAFTTRFVSPQPLTCGDAIRPSQSSGVRGLLRLRESSHHVGSSGFPGTWYTRPPTYRDAFLYSPAFAQALWPFGQLSWPAFHSIWIAGQAGVLGWLLVPWGWRRGLTLAPFFITELLLGNVYLFFAGALVVSLGRAPGALALPLLTKISPGVVGIWFVVRREWHAVMWAA